MHMLIKSRFMSDKGPLVIDLELNTIEDLFVVPDYNPFDPQNRTQSGMDEILVQVRNMSLKDPLKIRIKLSSSAKTAQAEQLVMGAWNRYCSFKIRECEQSIDQLQDQGKIDLVWALSISIILILGAFFTSKLLFLPEFIRYFLETGMGIIAWVLLWPPLDSILYEWRPCRRAQQMYKYIRSAILEINSELSG